MPLHHPAAHADQGNGLSQARVPRQEQVPRLRGILHTVTFPLAVAAGVVRVVLAPTPLARLAAAVDAVTSACPRPTTGDIAQTGHGTCCTASTTPTFT